MKSSARQRVTSLHKTHQRNARRILATRAAHDTTPNQQRPYNARGNGDTTDGTLTRLRVCPAQTGSTTRTPLGHMVNRSPRKTPTVYLPTRSLPFRCHLFCARASACTACHAQLSQLTTRCAVSCNCLPLLLSSAGAAQAEEEQGCCAAHAESDPVGEVLLRWLWL